MIHMTPPLLRSAAAAAVAADGTFCSKAGRRDRPRRMFVAGEAWTRQRS